MGNRKEDEIGIRGLQAISKLEIGIMNAAWENKQITVREVYEILLKKDVARKASGFIPYTTVMSTMSNLVERGFLKKNSDSKVSVYIAAYDNKKLARNIIKAVADTLLN